MKGIRLNEQKDCDNSVNSKSVVDFEEELEEEEKVKGLRGKVPGYGLVAPDENNPRH